jgi:TonB family protein
VASAHPDVRGTRGLGDTDATGTIGVGAIHTRGGKGDDAGYGHQTGGLGHKTDRDIIATQSPICLLGVFDPELIRRVVREHVGQVRYCYERALSSTPGLAGRVSLQWTINATGQVTAASIDDGSTLRNSDVEACLVQRVKTWRFSPPKDGGVVVVKYPFIFNRAG